MDDKAVLKKVPALLLAWYDGCARELPWREGKDPYRTWVSEIMLQQTRVEAAKPYFLRFTEQFPTVEALAAAPEEQLMKLWQGLGYYSRARNLQKGARQVMERFGGVIPSSFEELRSLPGVGDYTAGAIASIAYGVPVPAVDGNVLRVISRLLAREDDVLDPRVKKRTEGEIREIIPEDRAGDFNQSLMELGALICLPNGRPKCGECPLGALCRANARDLQEKLPVKAGKKSRKCEEKTVFLLSCKGKIALRRRPEKGLLAGLWELPSLPGKLGKDEAESALSRWGANGVKLISLPDSRHIFTHREWHMTAWAAEVEELLPGFAWAAAEDLQEGYALPSAFKAYFGEIETRTRA